ncbi:MAG: sialate O-acetylesterase [Planctomycetota bacterium]|nr:sialate O-acetylesterase [Planctomycetota bacterium]
MFVGAGQSNSTNSGETPLICNSDMVSTFDGKQWRIAHDPQPGCHDNSTRGSFWPAFGDELYSRIEVPVGVAVTGHGGTRVAQWQPGGELHNWMMARIHALGLGGFRAVLWHQGESDVNTPSDQYRTMLATTIRQSRIQAGWEIPWFVACVSYRNPENRTYESTRSAQQGLWKQGIALPGPDTDTLGPEYRDRGGKGIHFSKDGLIAHGIMWADIIDDFLKVLR